MIAAWTIAAAANAIMVVAYAAIAKILVRGIQQGNQWRTNPIAVATAGIFFSCGVGHGLHLLHLIPPYTTLDPAAASAAATMMGDPAMLVADVFTALVAAWYFLIRNRLDVVTQGASLCEDLAERQRQATVLNAKVVEGIADADKAFEEGRRDDGVRTLERTLEDSKSIITTLLGSSGSRAGLGPGDLRRDQPSR